MKYFLIVGEASGDLHASNLMKTIRQRDPQAVFTGLGGDKMQAEGMTLYCHYRDMAYMGVLAVLAHWRDIRRNFDTARTRLLADRPDVLILVDYPSFNLRMARFCRQHLPDTQIIYYIPPKVWAWKTYRIHEIAKLCDHVYAIFSFEPAFYARYGYSCEYVGNPTVLSVQQWQQEHSPSSSSSTLSLTSPSSSKPVIALLPGSRRSEIKHCLPLMLQAARHFPDCSVVVTPAPGIERSFYAPFLSGGETLAEEHTYAVLSRARAAIVTSGTATLETALLGCPQQAVYHIAAGKLLGWLKPFLFKIPFFTLVNIIAGREVIQEMVTYRFTEKAVTDELDRLLHDDSYRERMLQDYRHVYDLLQLP